MSAGLAGFECLVRSVLGREPVGSKLLIAVSAAVLHVPDDELGDDLRRHDAGRNQPSFAMKTFEELNARQDVGRLRAREESACPYQSLPGRTVIARNVGSCCSAANVRVSISSPALATQ